jgi:hypothetical protein
MRASKWTAVLAVLGVLVHAGAAAYHSASLAGATFQYLALRADLAVLCHGGSSSNAPADRELPLIPRPADGGNGCQVCCALGAAVALPAAEGAKLPAPPPAASPAFITADRTTPFHHAACPPARGPPVLA